MSGREVLDNIVASYIQQLEQQIQNLRDENRRLMEHLGKATTPWDESQAQGKPPEIMVPDVKDAE